ncbi:MAG TPA: nuclear transport factor 2 family protein, partial [Gaiellaceae bacterium]|nr:nuclear transport factor 2 family protein [Gaiellaceae bacterium]
AAVALLVLAAVPAAGARQGATPEETARPLVVRFFKLVRDRDVAGLATFLSPAFQLQRADGSGAGKAEYLDRLPTVRKFTLASLTASRAGSTLVARYQATVEGIVNGKPYTPGPAPRLSVFHWTGKRWQLIAHANFNPLTG